METGHSAIIFEDKFFLTQVSFYFLSTILFTPDAFMGPTFNYWRYKFRPLDQPTHFGPHPPPPPPSPNRPHFPRGSPMQNGFTSAFRMAGTFTALLTLIFLTIFGKHLRRQYDTIGTALIINLILLLVNLCFTFINTDNMQTEFFIFSITLYIIQNCATGFIGVGLFELVIEFPTFYTASLLSGQPICGIIVSSIIIGLLTTPLHSWQSAAIYFSVWFFLTLCTTIIYFIATWQSKYFIYKVQDRKLERPKTFCSQLSSLKNVLVRAKWYYAALFFIHGTTVLIHPGFTVNIGPSHTIDVWETKYFTPVVTFLGYSISNFIGRILARTSLGLKMMNCGMNLNTGKLLLSAASIRFLMLPMFLFCNAPKKMAPTYFGDNFFICLILIFAFTDGFLTNITLIKIFTFLDASERREAFSLIPMGIVLTSTFFSIFNILLVTTV